MTQNQIAWLNYLENVRSHRATEGETYRSNRVREKQGDIGLAQDLRRTLSQERVSLLGLREQHRHHRTEEGTRLSELSEKARAARAREFLERRKQDQDLWVARVKLNQNDLDRKLRDRHHVEKYSLDEREYLIRKARDRREETAQAFKNIGSAISSAIGLRGLVGGVSKLVFDRKG